MPHNTHAEIIIGEHERQAERGSEPSSLPDLHTAGANFAFRLGWLPGTRSSDTFSDRCRRVKSALKRVFVQIDAKFRQSPSSDDLRWLRDNASLIYAAMASLGTEGKSLL